MCDRSHRGARCVFLGTIGFLLAVAAPSTPAQATAAAAPTSDKPRRLVFAENHGQYASEVQFRSVLSGQVASFTADGLVLTQVAGPMSEVEAPLRGHTVRLRFVDARASATPARTWVGSEES